jgi:hypothetical protein
MGVSGAQRWIEAIQFSLKGHYALPHAQNNRDDLGL